MSRQDKAVVLALWCVAWLALFVGGAMAQTPVITQPYTGITTQNGSTVLSATDIFQSVFAAPDSTKNQKRAACTVQNNSATSSYMYVYFGNLATARLTLTDLQIEAISVKLSPGQPAFCNNSGVTVQEQVSVAGSTGDAFYAAQQ